MAPGAYIFSEASRIRTGWMYVQPFGEPFLPGRIAARAYNYWGGAL